MFQATSHQIENMQRAISKIFAGGDDAFVQAWLVWAQVHLATLDVPGPRTAATEKILPLIYCLAKSTDSPREAVHNSLLESLPRILFQAKLAGRDDLGLEDGYAALTTICGALKKGD